MVGGGSNWQKGDMLISVMLIMFFWMFSFMRAVCKNSLSCMVRMCAFSYMFCLISKFKIEKKIRIRVERLDVK